MIYILPYVKITQTLSVRATYYGNEIWLQINFNPMMDKQSHAQNSVGWN